MHSRDQPAAGGLRGSRYVTPCPKCDYELAGSLVGGIGFKLFPSRRANDTCIPDQYTRTSRAPG